MEIRLQANSNFDRRLLRESQRLSAPNGPDERKAELKNENDSKPRAAVNPVDFWRMGDFLRSTRSRTIC